MLNSQELMNVISRDYILGNITTDEQVELISEQIKDPFDSSSGNYFKRLRNMVKNEDDLNRMCMEFFTEIEDIYPNITFDLSSYELYEKPYAPVFTVAYKFFVKNIDKLFFVFLKEYIFSEKNRKKLLIEFSNMKLGNYPKEQYGKKENYILITKLPAIIKLIKEENVKLSKFINYIGRNEECPIYMNQVSKYVEEGIIVDHGVVADFFDQFLSSDVYYSIMNKLEMEITQNIILPYLEESGLSKVSIAPIVELADENDITDDEEDED